MRARMSEIGLSPGWHKPRCSRFWLKFCCRGNRRRSRHRICLGTSFNSPTLKRAIFSAYSIYV